MCCTASLTFGSDGSYVMCGDNQFAKERGIRDDQIIAVMTGFFRKGRAYTTQSLLYRLYINFWYYTRPFRRSYRFGSPNQSFRLVGPKANRKKQRGRLNRPRFLWPLMFLLFASFFVGLIFATSFFTFAYSPNRTCSSRMPPWEPAGECRCRTYCDFASNSR